MSLTPPELTVSREYQSETPTPRVETRASRLGLCPDRLDDNDPVGTESRPTLGDETRDECEELPAVSADLAPFMSDVLRITGELFPGNATVYLSRDPEYPEDGDCTVIEAPASGSVKDVVDRRLEWHRRVSRLSPICSALALTLDYQE